MTPALIEQSFQIAADDTWKLWTVILAGVAASIFLEQRFKWAARLSGPVLGLLIAMTLSTTGVMPTSAPVYDFVADYLIPMAIPLLLFQANLLRIIKVTGKMFLAFHISVLGTVFGTVIATLSMSRHIEHAPEIGGIMCASYSGGSVNFAAVKDTFKDTVHDNLTNPLIVADNFIMAGMFMVLLMLAGSRFFQSKYPHPAIGAADREGSQETAAAHWAPKPIGLKDIALALAIAFLIATVAREITGSIRGLYGEDSTSISAAILANQYVWITTLSLIAATLFHSQLAKIRGAEELGGYALYIYLFTIGLPANLIVVLTTVPAMFGYCAIIAVVNLLFTLGVGRIFRLNLEDLLISVNATLGGAPSAVAMAVSKGWPNLILPAMLIGIWGYVIGTAIGVAVAHLLSALVT